VGEKSDREPAHRRGGGVGGLKAAPPDLIALGELQLRRLGPEHLDDLVAAVEDSREHLRPWLIWAATPGREAHLEFLRDAAVAWPRGERYAYGIFQARGGLIGGIGLMRRIAPGGLEIGYWVHADHARRGVASRAAAGVTRAAFDLPDIDHVEIHHDEANIASGRVPARLGFEMVERVDAQALTPAEAGRDLIWRLTREGYPASGCPAILAAAAGAGPGA
jgi:RimJ/RimL family protein N-acetyltransferase